MLNGLLHLVELRGYLLPRLDAVIIHVDTQVFSLSIGIDHQLNSWHFNTLLLLVLVVIYLFLGRHIVLGLSTLNFDSTLLHLLF